MVSGGLSIGLALSGAFGWMVNVGDWGWLIGAGSGALIYRAASRMGTSASPVGETV